MRIAKYVVIGTGAACWIGATALFALYLHQRHGVLRKRHAPFPDPFA